jgi:DNA segregation ATPase FtsK/SpoIIIE, S-DNA-T family
MSVQQQLETSDSILPAGLRRFMRNRALELAGLGLLGAAGALTLALATWQSTDPSLNHAVDAAPSNALGYAGAMVADELLQWFGLASILVVAMPLIWSVRLMAHTAPARLTERIAGWLLACLTGAAVLSMVPVSPGLPLASGYGGGVGEVLSLAVQTTLGFLLHDWIATTLTAAALLVAFTLSLGLALDSRHLQHLWGHAGGPSPDNAGARGVIWLVIMRGSALVWAALLAVASWLWRLFREWMSKDENPPFVIDESSRVEPRFDYAAPPSDTVLPESYSGSFAPAMDEAAIDGDYEEDPSPDELPSPKITPAAKPPKQGKRLGRDRQPSLLEPFAPAFELPALTLLAEPRQKARTADISEESLAQNARMLEGVLDDFGVRGDIIHVRPGPVVTLYELQPAPGIKSSRVIGLADDIARSMSAVSCRVAVIPGRNVIGIELPNAQRETVFLRELLGSQLYERSAQSLCLALGKNIGGEPVFADLARMPHLLIAGTTGSGKSVGINTMILSILYRLPPERCRLIMIDPKMLELSVYEGIPHLLAPVVTDPRKAVVALKWAVREMEDRYRKMSKLGVRNIDGFNARVEQALAKGSALTRTVQTGFDPETGDPVFEQEALDLKPMPYIVVIIDEMADLMMVAGKDIEGAVQRLAQMARAAGIHVIMATQRPSVDVITGTIKANFPTRVSFQVTSKIDSRTILGEQGAEQLLGQGDMLYMAGGGRISRLHGPFVSDDEVEQIVRHLKEQGAPEYVDSVTEDDGESGGSPMGGGAADTGGGDDLYDQAVAVILRDKKVSTSYVQRRLQVGYNKAASLIERMEKEGVISAPNATGRRDILVQTATSHD